MRFVARLAALLLIAVASGPAPAQTDPKPPAPPASPTAPPTDPGAPLSLLPVAPAATPQAPMPERHRLTLEGRLTEAEKPLKDGLVWRVFGLRAGPDGKLPLILTRPGGAATLELPGGDYLVHAAFGRAGATKRVSVAGASQTESLVLNAGGLRLDAVVGDHEPVAPERLSFEVLRENDEGQIVTVVAKAPPGRVLRLPAGTYHVVSHYGTLNAVVRADIAVEAGKLTDASLRQSGAEVTLKLVSSEGGEAIANTNWSVVTEAGETVHQAVGAFPSIILAEGNYTAVARHDDDIYSRDFVVESGANHDVEVRLSDRIEGDPESPLEEQGPSLPAKPEIAVRPAPPAVRPAPSAPAEGLQAAPASPDEVPPDEPAAGDATDAD